MVRTVLTAGCLALAASQSVAQNYGVIDLTPTAGNAVVNGIAPGVAGGSVAPGIYGTATRAMIWVEAGAIDLHPAVLDDPATGATGRSSVLDASGTWQVGSGAGVATGNRSVPIFWQGTADSAVLLPIPFTHFGGQAHGTDGVQVVGSAIGLNRDGTVAGPSHALVWNPADGSVVDLGDGGNGAVAFGVAGGQQVGYVVRSQANAALWRGSRQSQVVLHPRGAALSVANATDGVRQVGYAGFDVRVRREAAKGNKTQRFNYAYLWTGTAASASNIHPYPVNLAPGVNLTQSYALAMNGGWIVGYAGDAARTGTPAYSHAIVWDADLQAVDLNAFLPEGFVGAQALSVDAEGTVAGFMAKADGTRHAVIWVPQAAE